MRKYEKIFLENAFYYLSTMTLFNLIYALKILGTNFNDGKAISTSNCCTFAAVTFLAFLGFMFTVIMILTDHSIKSKNTKGKSVTIIRCSDITGDNFFSKYSLLVLTGNSLPVFNNYISLIVYFLVFVTLFIVYSENKMYYLNPCITIFKYRIVKAYTKDSKEYYFIYKSGEFKENIEVSFVNTQNRIIRLKKVSK